MSIRPLLVAAALLAAAAVTASALASNGTSARVAATQQCFNFTVVQPDPQAGFAAGVYRRQNFSPGNTLSCNTSFDVFRSYLYDPQTHRGWSVGPLVGPLRNAQGKRFIRTGTNGAVGFSIYRNAPAPQPRTITRTLNLVAGTTRTYQVSIPTRTADVGESVQLVNGGPAQIVQSGFNIVGPNTVYFARVQVPQLVGFNGQVQFRIQTQR
jgi:hypothetical protein